MLNVQQKSTSSVPCKLEHNILLSLLQNKLYIYVVCSFDGCVRVCSKQNTIFCHKFMFFGLEKGKKLMLTSDSCIAFNEFSEQLLASISYVNENKRF